MIEIDNVLIATYMNPDLDGFACAFALNELLTKKGILSVSPFIGNKQLEVDFLMKRLGIVNLPKLSKQILLEKNIVLVDASDLRGLDERIDPLKVKYVIDHRKHYDKNSFPNAQFDIHLVGSAATLITEMFLDDNLEISQNSATLLYYAIISNTINFKAKVTHERDIKAFKWLSKKGAITTLQREIFDYKTANVELTKQSVIENYIAIPKVHNVDVLVIQFEIAKVSNFIMDNIDELKKIISVLMSEYSLKLGFYTFVDIEEGNNYFIAGNQISVDLLKRSLNLEFKEQLSKRNGILMRKEIIPKLKIKADNK